MILPHSAACDRNQGPILRVLDELFANTSAVLEIGSGTGQHAVTFGAALPHLTWYPTEQPGHLRDLIARIEAHGTRNVNVPQALDVTQSIWPALTVNAVYTANTLHILSWRAVMAALHGAGALLPIDGIFCVYGPFRYQGAYISITNEAFDELLRSRNPSSGIRDIEAVRDVAARAGLQLEADHDMPANNRLLVFRKEPV